jgi:hypothetical protein
MSSLPDYAIAIIKDPQWQKEKAEFDRRSAELDRLAAPVIAGAAWRWLEFTPEAREQMAGDPDIAFQTEWDGWVIRMDFAGEIGDGSFWWRKGHEAEAVAEWDLFAHGTPTRPATPEELAEWQWALNSAIRSYVHDIHRSTLALVR